MKKFIESICNQNDKIEFSYKKYDTLFIKEKYHMFYLFFFLKDESEIIKLKEETGEVFKAIKNSKDIYEIDMDKNTTCIYCLKIDDKEYYKTEETGVISGLSKKICLVEEDLNFFKKNVFIYTDNMKKFADKYIGGFDGLCRKMITEENFQLYKKSHIKNYEYDLLINLFIKLPFLNFKKYQLSGQEEYKSVNSFINEEFNEKNIDKYNINEEMKILEEKINDEDRLYDWLDQLIENENNSTQSKGAIQNEN